MQVVISTHSPEFIRDLPDDAIKVLEATPSGRVTLANSSSPLVAFKRLGLAAPGRLRVIVEDALAKQVADVARRQLPEGEDEIVDIVVVPGGAEMILSHYIPSAIAADDDTYVLLDGDKAFSVALPNLNNVAPIDEPQLGTLIKNSTGVDPALYLTGGDDPDLSQKKIEAQKKYIKWVQSRVQFLPRVVPEEIIIFSAFPQAVSELDGTAETAKKILYDMLAKGAPEANAEQVAVLAGYELMKSGLSSSDIGQVRDILTGFVAAWRDSHG